MPINTPSFLEMQKAGRQLGELRFGTTTTTNGKTRPVKLETWRFTTDSPRLAVKVAEYFGKEAKRVELANHKETFEIMTDVDSLKVIIPPGETAIDQWMEMWSGGGCARRCDGTTEQISQKPCMCPANTAERVELGKRGKACKPTTRARVMLPYIDGLGVWRVASTGFHAAVELGGDTMRLAEAQARGMNLPAVLWLNKRKEIKGGQTREYMVPCLDVEMPLEQIVAIASGGGGSLRSVLGISTVPNTAPTSAGALEVQSTSTTTPSLKSVPDPDDEILEAELVESTVPNTGPTTASPVSASVATVPTSEGAVDPGQIDVPDTGGSVKVQSSTAAPIAPNSEPSVQVQSKSAGKNSHTSVGSVQVQSDSGGVVASKEQLSALQIKRAHAALTGGPWAKFAAKTLGRGVSPTEYEFSESEAQALLSALDSYEPGK